MKDTQNITIVLLLVTAAILSAVLLSVYTTKPAYGDASVRQGDYIMVAGSLRTSKDLVYILDIAARRLNVYYADTNNNTIELINNVDLERAFPE